ncbi:MAG: prolyl oligopeptidase family serine peptidase, partial [Phycisphaerales bacterium]
GGGAGVHFKFVSARTWQSRQEPEVRTLVLSRTWFALYEPTRAGDPAGVALVMPGLFNTPEPVIEHLIEQFRKRGWAVLRMMAQPSRFTERTTIRIDPQNLESAAERAAAEMQDRVAECAYAAQAAFQHLGAEKPALAKLPCIAVGMSGGAMTLPSVVALEPQRYAAAVLIAGGADFVTIALESNYRFMVDSIRFDWPEPPTDDQQKALAALYLQRAPLDSFHTAAALKGKPVLMIHGTHDAAVPAHLGDLLWERLGRPERWSEEAGHEEVFMRLPKKAGDILDWLDKAIRRE